MTGTSEAEQKFIEEGFAEIDQMNLEKFKANDSISKIIAASVDRYEKITINGIDIRFRPFLTPQLRRKFHAAQKVESTDPEVVDDILYGTLAAMCVDDPFTSPDAWKYMETLGGDVQGILRQIMAKITENSTATADFRKK